MSGSNQAIEDKIAYERGRDLLGQGKVEEGIALLLEIAPREPRVLGDVAWAFKMRGDGEAALKYLNEFVGHFPDDPGAWLVMAQISRERNEARDAARYAQKAAAANPLDARTWFELGEILLYAHEFDASADAFGKSLEIDPDMGRAAIRREFARRFGGSGVTGFLRRWMPRWLVPESVLASGLFSALIEQVTGIAVDDNRWTAALDWGPATPNEGFEKPEADEVCEAQLASTLEWLRAAPVEGDVRKVLEIGFGTGELAAALAEEGREVLSVTRSEFARRDRKRRGVESIRADIHLIRRPGGAFDMLVDNYAMHRSRAALFALWEWRRLLRPDGYLVVAAHLANELSQTVDAPNHRPFGAPGHAMTLTYWQLRWLIKQTDMQLLAETLIDPANGVPADVEHVDGRLTPDPDKVWDVLLLLRKPGRLPYDGELEKPRPLKQVI